MPEENTELQNDFGGNSKRIPQLDNKWDRIDIVSKFQKEKEEQERKKKKK